MRHQINLPKEGKKQRKLHPAILRTIFNFLNVHFQFKTETEYKEETRKKTFHYGKLVECCFIAPLSGVMPSKSL